MVVATASLFTSSNVRGTFVTGAPFCALTIPEITLVLVGTTVGKDVDGAVGEAVGDLLRDPIGEATVDDRVGELGGKAMGASVGELPRIVVLLLDDVFSIVKVISSGAPATPPPPGLEKGVALRMFIAPSSYGHE
jgi:hypothetical protein